MVAPTNVRFPDAVDQRLADYARQTGAKNLISRHHASQDEALAAWERRQALDAI